MSETLDKNEQGLKLFLLAWVHGSKPVPVFNTFTKTEIRAYRADVLAECERQRSTNPMAVAFMRGIAGIPLADLGEIMLNMKRIHDEYEANDQT